MNLSDLLRSKDVDPQQVLAFRHRPLEPELNKVLPWLAAEKPEVFNAYQQAQTKQVEQKMTRAGYVAAFNEQGLAGLVAGLLGTKSWQQSWSGWMEISYVPICSA